MVKRRWESEDVISGQDRAQVKAHIIQLMLKSPENIQRQLSEAISIIGRIDFYEKWQELIPEIVGHIATGDFTKINGCLRTVHSIFKRYRYEIKVSSFFALKTIVWPIVEKYEVMYNLYGISLRKQLT